MADARDEGSLGAVFGRMPRWLRFGGVYGWLFVGALGLCGGVFWLISYTSDLVMPLAVAAVLGVLFAPIVDWMARRSIPRGAGAGLVLVLLLAVIVATIWLVVTGVIGQSATIGEQVTAGIDSVVAWATSLNLPAGFADQVVTKLGEALEGAGGSIASALSKGLSGTAAFLSGLFLGGFMLYFILKDWGTISDWLGKHLGVPATVGVGLLDDAVGAMRGYFESVTVTGLIVAVIVGVAMALLGVPLAVPIALVTWLTCYIPYVGALISSVFAVLIALGSGGLGLAVAALVVVILAQNVVQTIIQNRMASERLNVHPLSALIATILGGILGGLLGSMLAPALLAFAIRAYARLKEARAHLVAPAPATPATTEG
jgi:putative heme transporter